MKRDALLVIFITLLFFSLISSLAYQQEGDKKTEIVIIGTDHSVLFLHPGFTPAHLRALLSKVVPVAVCIEELPNFKENGSINSTWPEENYATLTWAEKHNVSVLGVDWEWPNWREIPSAWEQARQDTTKQARWEDFKSSTYRSLLKWEAEQVFGESDSDIESIQQLSEKDHKEPENLAMRDDHITENIVRVALKYPGQRIAVVIGSYHLAPQAKRLKQKKEIKVISIKEFFPLTNEEIEAAWYDDDTIILLGANLDSYQILGAHHSRNHQKSKELLDKLLSKQSNSPITKYYTAKWKFLFGDLEKAKEILENILGEKKDTALPYHPDRRWSWPPLPTIEQKARFYLAAIHDLEGNHDEATKYYRELLSIKPESILKPLAYRKSYIDLRSYLESLIENPYRDGLYETFRVLEAMR